MVSIRTRFVEEYYIENHESERPPICRSAAKHEGFQWVEITWLGSVINNRPDGEEPAQPTADEAADEAKAAGLRYVRQPIVLGAITEADIRQFQKTLADLEGPIFAHCKSGTRSLTLWTLGEVLDGRMQASEIIPFGEQHGVDLKVAAKWAADRSGANNGAK